MPYDYYHVLGVSPAADQELIAKAYRLLARRHHPDRGGEPTLFQQVEEAYRVLSDSHTRLRYDRSVLSTNGGTYGSGGGQNIYQILPLRFEQAARGGRITITRLGPHPRRIEVQVPPCTDEGDRLRIAGQGLPARGAHGVPGAPGDLILIAAPEPHPRMRREGLDLLTDAAVPLDVALQGGTVTVQGLDGDVVMEVPAGTSSGQRLRARAAGLRTLDGRYGDLHAVVQIQIPPPRTGATDRVPGGEEIGQRLGERARELGEERERLEKFAAELQARAEELDRRARAAPGAGLSPDSPAARQELEDEQERFETQRQHLERQRQQVQKAVETAQHLSDEAQRRHGELDGREASLAQRHSEIEKRAAALDRARDELSEARRCVEAQRQALERERAELDSASRQTSAKRKLFEEQQRQLREAQAEYARARQELREKEHQFERRDRQLLLLETELKARADELSAREAAAQQREEQVREQGQQLESARAELERRQAQIAAAEKGAAETQQRLASEAAKLKELDGRLVAQQNSLKEAQAAADSERAAAQQQIEEQRRGLEAQEARLEAIERQIRADRQGLEAQQAAVRADRERLEQERAELARGQRDLEQRDHELTAKAGSHATAQADLLTAQEKVEEQRCELKALGQKIAADHQALDARESALREARAAVDADRGKLQAERAEAVRRQQELEQREHELAAAKTALLAAEQKVAADRQSLEAQQSVIQADRERLEGERAELARGQRQLEQREQELTATAESQAAAQAELFAAREKVEEQRRESESEATRLRNLEQQVAADRQNLEALQVVVSADREQLEKERVQIARRERELEDRERELAAGSGVVRTTEAALAEQRRRADAERTELAALRKELEERRGKAEVAVRSQREAIDAERAELVRLRGELDERAEALTTESAVLDSRLSELSQRRSRLAERLRQLRARRGESQRLRFDLAARAAQLQTTAEALERRISAAEAELRGRSDRVQQLEQENEIKRREVVRREADLWTMRQQVEAERVALAERVKELERRETELSVKEAQVRERVLRAEEERTKVQKKAEAAEPLPTVTLVLLDANGVPRRYALARREITIGRDRPANLRILQSAVSRTHCRIEVWPGSVWIEDLGSRNGTYRNGQKVTRNKLEPGDTVAVGDVRFAVVIDGNPEQIQPPPTNWPSTGELVEHDAGVRSLDRAAATASLGPKPRAQTPVEEEAGETIAGKVAPRTAGKPIRRKPKLATAAPAEVIAPRFELVKAGNRAVFELAPHHVRCGAGYVDRAGVRHLFIDYVDSALKATNTWSAEVRYYRHEQGSAGWEWVATVAERGSAGQPDSHGAASPHVICAGGQMLLLYAGRSVAGGKPANITAKPGQPGYLRSAIMLAVAPINEHGAPAGSFVKRGAIIEPGSGGSGGEGLGWDTMRLDHPCAVLDREHLHIFYTAYDDAMDLSHRVVGCATGSPGGLADLRFTKHPAPVLAVEGGGQMPRVFRHRGLWHMFYQHLSRSGAGAQGRPGARWRHYIATDPLYWREHNAQFFEPPQDQSGELTLWTDLTGRLPREPVAWLSAPVSNIYQLFEYSLDIKL